MKYMLENNKFYYFRKAEGCHFKKISGKYLKQKNIECKNKNESRKV